MNKVNTLIFVESRYKVNRKKIKSRVEDTLKNNQIESSIEVSVAIVGDRKMRELSKKYKNEDKTRNVLSFSQTETRLLDKSADQLPQNRDVLMLGDIVISYPQVIRDASRDEMLVDDKIDQLLEHGLMHLLGLHHDD